VGNGDDSVWKAIDSLRKDVQNVATNGCAHKTTHDSFIVEIRNERRERQEMRKELTDEMKNIRNQILGGIVILMALTLVVDKVLK